MAYTIWGRRSCASHGIQQPTSYIFTEVRNVCNICCFFEWDSEEYEFVDPVCVAEYCLHGLNVVLPHNLVLCVDVSTGQTVPEGFGGKILLLN